MLPLAGLHVLMMGESQQESLQSHDVMGSDNSIDLIKVFLHHRNVVNL